ncbi:hypothetical protein V6N12_014293 [Hibiscus sabdariffa]|uniref:Reverse transcriptase zinc-binding domain-containing protein n=1 Tax=Hibiscus sabdariffa TaxID=183260 RepID=A0ABR2DJR1_9ROSI
MLTGGFRFGWRMRILTNTERAHWHMTSNSSCPVCAFPVEDIHHVLRSCPVAYSIWRRCIHHDRLDEFMNLEIKDRIYTNLSNVGDLCLILPIEMCYLACIRLQQECLAGRLGDLRNNVDVRRAACSVIRWHRPLKGWCKLNNDGAVAVSSGDSVCSGVICNVGGDWLIGFNRRFGICSVLESELWGIYEGLMTA